VRVNLLPPFRTIDKPLPENWGLTFVPQINGFDTLTKKIKYIELLSEKIINKKEWLKYN